MKEYEIEVTSIKITKNHINAENDEDAIDIISFNPPKPFEIIETINFINLNDKKTKEFKNEDKK